MALSENAQKVEAANLQSQQKKEQESLDEDIRVYWHQAKEGQLGNYELEKYDGGRLANPERPLRFYEHQLVVDMMPHDEELAKEAKKKVHFIEHHDSYRKNTVIFCGTGTAGRAKAAQMTTELGQKKEVRIHNSSIDETQPTVTDVKDLPDSVMADHVDAPTGA